MDPENSDHEAYDAMEALLAEPFPDKPYALVPEGGENSVEHQDYIIHKDLETENQCVLLFDSIVDAFAVAQEYQEATGKNAEPVECNIFALEEERFWVKFYRANGMIAILPVTTYKQCLSSRHDE